MKAKASRKKRDERDLCTYLFVTKNKLCCDVIPIRAPRIKIKERSPVILRSRSAILPEDSQELSGTNLPTILDPGFFNRSIIGLSPVRPKSALTALYEKKSTNSEEEDPEYEENKQTTHLKSVMISFHVKNTQQPVVSKVKLAITPVTRNPLYKQRLDNAAFKADPSKHHEYRGTSNYYSYGFIPHTNAEGTPENSLLEIKFEREKLRKRNKDVGFVSFAEGIFPVMEECLKVVKGSDKNHSSIVQRRLALGLIKIHQQLNDLGIPTYHAWISKRPGYTCDEGKLEEWNKRVNHLRLIKYVSPENMIFLQRDGSISGYVPRPAEDIWALGIIFYSLLWNGELPAFVELHRQIRDLARAEPFDDAGFQKAKAHLIQAYCEFHDSHLEEGKEDPLKQLVLDMLNLNPANRITAAECLKRLQKCISDALGKK